MGISRILNWLLGLVIGVLQLCLMPSSIEAQDDYEAWLQEQAQQFKSFKDARDRAFNEFLKQSWQPINVKDMNKTDVQPKPVKIPIYEPALPDLPRIKKEIEPIDIISRSPQKKYPKRKEKDRSPQEEKKIQPGQNVNFFGQILTFYDMPQNRYSDHEPLSNEVIRTFWATWSRMDYQRYLERFEYYIEKHQLNDWGYLQMLYATGKTLYPESRNQVRLFVWFMLNKSGYIARAGYQGNQVFLLAPTSLILYEHSYFVFDGREEKFYAIMFDKRDKPKKNSVIYTYDEDYPGTTQVLNMTMNQLPALPGKISQKTLTFNHNGQIYRTAFDLNKYMVDFLETYPQTTYEIYFQAPLSPDTKNSLLATLKQATEDMSETEAVNLLLHFVQTAFEYKTDVEQFDKEKTMFPEETLYYTSSDCEDRAILFAYLVRQLVGLDVIGLDYPGHIATAVKFNTKVEGDVVRHKNSTYTICDPTYIFADIGKPIPQVQNLIPSIINTD